MLVLRWVLLSLSLGGVEAIVESFCGVRESHLQFGGQDNDTLALHTKGIGVPMI